MWLLCNHSEISLTGRGARSSPSKAGCVGFTLNILQENKSQWQAPLFCTIYMIGVYLIFSFCLFWCLFCKSKAFMQKLPNFPGLQQGACDLEQQSHFNTRMQKITANELSPVYFSFSYFFVSLHSLLVYFISNLQWDMEELFSV